MFSSEIGSRVAQNCHLYYARSYYTCNSFNNMDPNCNNCVNYVRGHCIKGTFDEIYNKIRVN